MNQQRIERIAEAEYDLYRAGFGWITNNGGVHLQVVYKGKVVADMWPTTHKMIVRKPHLDMAIFNTLNKISRNIS